MPAPATLEPAAPAQYRFTGHQSFSLRIAWLPKATDQITRGNDPFSNIDEGIVSLGLGKNMIESLETWIRAFQIAEKSGDRWSLTDTGDLIFGKKGMDRSLADPVTPWVLHWLISTNRMLPFLAWEILINRWSVPEFTASEVLEVFRRETEQAERKASCATLKQHWEVFLHTYKKGRATRGEDVLDSALAILGLVENRGERQDADGRWEPIFGFSEQPKTGVSQDVFTFCLHDWWNRSLESEHTVAFREVINAPYSPGRVLKMKEPEVSARLIDLASRRSKYFGITQSAGQRLFVRHKAQEPLNVLEAAYRSPRYLEI
jgi:hypothetical protein